MLRLDKHLTEDVTSCFSSDLIRVMHQCCLCKVRKIQFKCKGERAGGETYLWKIITSEKIWSWLPVPNILQHFVIASPQPLLCQIAAIFPLWSVERRGGRNLNVTIAESIWKLSIELRFCGVKWLFKTSIRFLIRAEWDLISKLILVNDFWGCQRLLCLNPIF